MGTRICLVTGATGGIGSAIVRAMRAEGDLVLASDLDGPLAFDLATTDGPRLLAEAALAVHGRVDVLVNCAGVGLYGPAAEVDGTERLVALNLTAPIELTRALLPQMLERRAGNVVNVASVVAHLPKRLEATYAATKSGLAGFTRSLRAELRDSGVGVSLVSPAVVDTAFFAGRGAVYERRWPKPVSPDRVAEAVLTAIRHNRAEVLVPRWLVVPVRLYGAAPGLYRGLSRPFD